MRGNFDHQREKSNFDNGDLSISSNTITSSNRLTSKETDIDHERKFYEEVEIDIYSELGPNSTWPIDNDFFHGRLCLLFRDHPRCYYDFDNEKDVFFEFQVQGKFKRKPKGPLYIGLEIPKGKEIKISFRTTPY